MKKTEFRILIIMLIIHFVGIAGLMSDELRPMTLKTTPLVILIGFLVALSLQPNLTFKLILLICTIGVAGFFIEYAGVQTGWIFGQYAYGKTLGYGHWGIPYIIGVNWAALVFYTAQIRFKKVKGILLPAVLSASLMTVFDFVLEPNAMRYDFWQWDGGVIPLQNYFSWFLISLVFHLLLNLSKLQVKPAFGRWIFAIQFGFFGLLSILNYLL